MRADAASQEAPVLIVDDNASARRVLVDLTSRFGLPVLEAKTAGEAWQILQVRRKSGSAAPVVVYDAYLPEADGFQFIELLNAKPDLAAGIVLMLTSNRQSKDGARCRELADVRSVIKPVREEDLQNAIVESLRSSGAMTIESAPLP